MTYEEYQKKQRDKLSSDYERGASKLSEATERNLSADYLQIDTKAGIAIDEQKANKQAASDTHTQTVDKAAVQRLVDEQHAAERLSALGLGFSGTKAAAMSGAANRQTKSVQTANATYRSTLSAIDHELASIENTANTDKEAAYLKRWAAFLQDDADLWGSTMKQADSTALSLYKADRSAETDRYKADKSAEATKYKADKDSETDKYKADKSAEATKYKADKDAEASKYKADASVAATIYKADKDSETDRYKADQSAEATKYKADASAAATIYKADSAAEHATVKLYALVDQKLRKQTNGAYGLSATGAVVAL